MLNKLKFLPIIILLFVSIASCGRAPYDEGGAVGEECKYVDTNTLRSSVLLDVPYTEQLPNYCGPASLEMVLGYYGKDVDQVDIGTSIVGPRGVSSEQLRIQAYGYGFNSSVSYCDINNLLDALNSDKPVIVRVLNNEADNGHFMVAVGYDLPNKILYINDPANPYHDEMTFQEFEDIWDIKTLQTGSNSYDFMMILDPIKTTDESASI